MPTMMGIIPMRMMLMNIPGSNKVSELVLLLFENRRKHYFGFDTMVP